MTARRNLSQRVGLLAILFGCASAFVHPFGNIKRVTSTQALFAGAEIDEKTAALAERSCQNCHSDRTTWPWYSYVPPISWIIERDVAEARLRMNFSRWSEYTPAERQAYLGIIAAAVRNRQMPPANFTLLHPEALLTAPEQEQIYRWARGERRRLKDNHAFVSQPVMGASN